MSLPTYIRRRRRTLQQFIAESYRLPMDFVEKLVQGIQWWQKNDFEGYYINPTKRHVRPFWLVPKLASEQALSLGPAGSGADISDLVAFEVDTQGHFEIAYAMFVATSPDFLVEIFDGGNNMKGLQNLPLHAVTVAGSARRPFIWPETYFLNVEDAPRTLFCRFRNLSAQANTIRWCFHGRRWYHKEASPEVQTAIRDKIQRMEKTYTYFLTLQPLRKSTPEGANPPAVTLSPGQALVENEAPVFKATDEADTEVYKLTYKATGPFEFQLREKQSGRTLSNGMIQVTNGWGDGEFPFILPETHLIERNYEVAFEVHDLSGAENRIYATLTGRRLQYA